MKRTACAGNNVCVASCHNSLNLCNTVLCGAIHYEELREYLRKKKLVLYNKNTVKLYVPKIIAELYKNYIYIAKFFLIIYMAITHYAARCTVDAPTRATSFLQGQSWVSSTISSAAVYHGEFTRVLRVCTCIAERTFKTSYEPGGSRIAR